jgi:hypothetical protein
LGQKRRYALQKKQRGISPLDSREVKKNDRLATILKSDQVLGMWRFLFDWMWRESHITKRILW